MFKLKLSNVRLWVTFLLLIVLIVTLIMATRIYYGSETELCFRRINSYASNMSELVANDVKQSRSYLDSVGGLLAQLDFTDTEKVGQYLNTMGDTGLITRIELFLPDGTIIDNYGDVSVAPETRDYSVEKREAEKLVNEETAYIFWEKGKEEGQITLRQSVPVKRDGRTAALICGIIDLNRAERLFFAQEYGDDVQLYIFERHSGQYLLDTWHSKLTTRQSLGERKLKSGYTVEKFESDIKNGVSGNIVFLSATIDEDFYSAYTPIDVDDWTLMITVPQHAVFANADKMLRFLYIITMGLVAMFTLYFIWTLRDIHANTRLGEMKLKNIRYILDIENSLFSSRLNFEGVHSALQKVADFLPSEKAFFYAGASFGCFGQTWFNDGSTEEVDVSFSTSFPRIFAQICESGELMLFDSDAGVRASALSEGRLLLEKLDAHSVMIVPVKTHDGSVTGLLGAINLEQNRESCEPLSQVSISFSMAYTQYETYIKLDKMSYMDAMTGLRNRNAFHKALDEMERNRPESAACLYVDANGLHELNNTLGHTAGDEMLTCIARALDERFDPNETFRIGGDEFVVLCANISEEEIIRRANDARRQVREACYEISCGVAWACGDFDPNDIVNTAEKAMSDDKRHYYENVGLEERKRLREQKAALISSKQKDIEVFLSTITPYFRGVYFVDLNDDTARYVLSVSRFEPITVEDGTKFSDGLEVYASRFVKQRSRNEFRRFCNYDSLMERLARGEAPRLVYDNSDGVRIALSILNVGHEDTSHESLWIFSPAANDE